MQLQTEKLTSISRGVEGHWNYQVANSPKVMAMLGDMLYKDKILAPVRELTANAIDAHIEAGTTDKAIHFTIPSAYDDTPIFKIRDYGCGMSEEKMIRIYRIYGLSDKDGDNSKTGCLGLGSKSPFAYEHCDSFTTISYYNGRKYVYVNTKLPNGVPDLQKMGDYPTDEENGLEVSFTVRSCDIPLFKEKLAKVLKRCPIPYKCNTELNIKKLNDDVLIEDKDWKVFNTGVRNPVAVMGHIEYPIDPYQFNGNNRDLLEMPIELYFDIGEIEMDISREGLQYNSYTLNAINKKLDKINDALYNMMQEKINSATCLYDARELKYQFESKFDWIARGKTFYWNSKKINNNNDITDILRTNNKYENTLYLYKYSGYASKVKHRTVVNLYNVHYNQSLAIIIDDVGKTARARVSYFIRNQQKYNGALIFEKSLENDVIDLLGIPQDRLFYVSKLDKPPKSITTSGSSKSYNARKIDLTKISTIDSYFVSCGDCSINKKLGQQYYITASRNIYFFGQNTIALSTVIDYIKTAKLNKIDIPDTLYVVPPSKKADVDRWGWININDYFVEECQTLIDDINKKKLALGYQSINALSNIDFLLPQSFRLSNGLFKKYARFMNYLRTKQKEANNLIALCRYLNIPLDDIVNKFKIDFTEIEKRLLSRYPMFDILRHVYYKDSDVCEKMIQYINFIDSLQNAEK